MSKYLDSIVGRKFKTNIELFFYSQPVVPKGSIVTLVSYGTQGPYPEVWVKWSRWYLTLEYNNETYFYDFTNQYDFRRDFVLIRKVKGE